MNLKQLRAGDKVRVSAKQLSDTEAIFLGFSDDAIQHSTFPVFATWEAVKADKHVSTFKALEAHNDARPQGYEVYALFLMPNRAHNDRVYIMRAYLFEGRWSVLSGAEPLTILESK
jgi:hypothetical protein